MHECEQNLWHNQIRNSSEFLLVTLTARYKEGFVICLGSELSLPQEENKSAQYTKLIPEMGLVLHQYAKDSLSKMPQILL